MNKTLNMGITTVQNRYREWSSRMLRPRWKKVLGDLWSNKTRTALVVMSIFIGVFAVGIIGGAQLTLSQEMNRAYRQTSPAHATISVSSQDGFHDDMVQIIRDIEGVAEAEAQTTIGVQVQVGPDRWMDMQLIAIPDFDDMRVATLQHEQGAWPPPDKTVLIERSGLGHGAGKVNATVGDAILVERPDGKQRVMDISGSVGDLAQAPSGLMNVIYGYITFDTLEWLGEPRQYTQVQLRFTGDTSSQEHNQEIAQRVYDKLQKSGRDPSFPMVPTPGQHWANSFVSGISALMGMLAVLSIILSGFLVTNTISALLAQQTRQIGILKSIGARPRQIMGLYVVLVLCFGLIAFLIALLLTSPATTAFVGVVMGFFNFNSPDSINLPIGLFVVQAVVSIGVPVIASLLPIFLGTRITVREAMDSDSIQQGKQRQWVPGFIKRRLETILRAFSSLFNRPLLLSLRNTFRRKGRVVLTLLTLTLGGAIFMAVFSVWSSLNQTLDDVLDSLYAFDMQISLDRSYRADHVVKEIERVPGVKTAESWNELSTRRVMPDGSEGEQFILFGVPPDTAMMEPPIKTGRWLLPDDENAIVLSTDVMNDNPDLKVGDTIVIKVGEREESWSLVGVMVTIQGMSNAYTPFEYFGRATHDVGKTQTLVVKTTRHERSFVAEVAENIENYLQRQSIDVSTTTLMQDSRETSKMFFAIVVGALLAMSLVIAAVGGLGLAGTMSLNVIERTREIGVMRAIGASNLMVLQVVMLEGIVLGILSWLLAALLSFPMSKLLIETVGEVLMGTSLSFAFSFTGLWTWLIGMLVLAIVSSFLPAWNASRVSVRQVLAHE